MEVIRFAPRNHLIFIPAAIRRVVIAGACIGFIACHPAKVRNHKVTFSKPVNGCEEQVLSDRYIVEWVDGRRTVEFASSDAEFLDHFFTSNKDQIVLAEPDYKIKLEDNDVELEHNEGGGEDRKGHRQDDGGEQPDPPKNIFWGAAAVKADEIWNLSNLKLEPVLVGILDSGVQTDHPLLKEQMAVNTNEIPDNLIDDDKNGYVDDEIGYDFYRRTGKVSDSLGHGTHIAGVIAATHNTDDIFGIAPNAKLIPLNFMDHEGSGALGDAILAVQYAVHRGARVMNASWGGAQCSKVFESALRSLEEKNVLFISAAGNVGSDLDVSPEYPAAYGFKFQITVGASTRNDWMADFSNFGLKSVHLVAPGQEIKSTYPLDKFRTLSGTSMAVPFVTGAIALLWGAFPEATAAQMRDVILKSVDSGPFKVSSHGRLNVKAAYDRLLALNSPPLPEAPGTMH